MVQCTPSDLPNALQDANGERQAPKPGSRRVGMYSEFWQREFTRAKLRNFGKWSADEASVPREAARIEWNSMAAESKSLDLLRCVEVQPTMTKTS